MELVSALSQSWDTQGRKGWPCRARHFLSPTLVCRDADEEAKNHSCLRILSGKLRRLAYIISRKDSCRRWSLWQARTIAFCFSGIWFCNPLSWASSSRRASLAFPSWSPAWCSWWACSSLQFFFWWLEAQMGSGNLGRILHDFHTYQWSIWLFTLHYTYLLYIILTCFATYFASVSHAAVTKVSCLLSFHSFLILANLTTWEHISWRHITYLMLASCGYS